jgi:probable RNA-binding protein EIF1AD
LTDQVLFDFPEPAYNERIAKVVATRGSNQFDVIVARSMAAGGGGGTTGSSEPVLAILPTKFRKLVWVKRNDYVIVQTVDDDDDGDEDEVGEDESEEDERMKSSSSSQRAQEKNKKKESADAGIRYMITHILYKDQIKHLHEAGLWPVHDPSFHVEDAHDLKKKDLPDSDDGIVYGQSYNLPDDDEYEGGEEDEEGLYHQRDDDLLFINTNRIANVALEDSSSSDDESSER